MTLLCAWRVLKLTVYEQPGKSLDDLTVRCWWGGTPTGLPVGILFFKREPH